MCEYYAMFDCIHIIFVHTYCAARSIRLLSRVQAVQIPVLRHRSGDFDRIPVADADRVHFVAQGWCQPNPERRISKIPRFI